MPEVKINPTVLKWISRSLPREYKGNSGKTVLANAVREHYGLEGTDDQVLLRHFKTLGKPSFKVRRKPREYPPVITYPTVLNWGNPTGPDNPPWVE